MAQTMWRVRKGSDISVGMLLRFGNVVTRVERIEDGYVYCKRQNLAGEHRFRLDARQSYRVLVNADGSPVIS